MRGCAATFLPLEIPLHTPNYKTVNCRPGFIRASPPIWYFERLDDSNVVQPAREMGALGTSTFSHQLACNGEVHLFLRQRRSALESHGFVCVPRARLETPIEVHEHGSHVSQCRALVVICIQNGVWEGNCHQRV